MVKWTAEKDQVLLRAVFQFLEIKTTPALLEHLAEQIGEGCTPKAISHRLNNIKNAGTPNKVAAADKAPLRKKLTPLKTPGSGRGRGRPPAKKVVHDDDDDDAEDAEVTNDIPDNHFDAAMSPSAGRKRARQAAGAEDKFSKKKIKEEKFSDDEGVDVGESAEDGDHEDGEEMEEEMEETEEEIDEI